MIRCLHFCVPHLDATKDFYVDALGFHKVKSPDEDELLLAGPGAPQSATLGFARSAEGGQY